MVSPQLLLVFRAIVGAGMAIWPTPPKHGWGSVKGRIVWGPKEIPKREPVNITQDKMHCMSKGDVLDEKRWRSTRDQS